MHGGNPGAILYFHGGAFLTCGLNTHRNLVSRISYAAGQPVLNVGYRQMPLEPITESVADGVVAFRWLLDQGYRPENITIAGDSAGGYLAFSVARAVIDAGWGRPAGVVAISPLLDVDSTGKRNHRNADRCETFPLNALERFTRWRCTPTPAAASPASASVRSTCRWPTCRRPSSRSAPARSSCPTPS